MRDDEDEDFEPEDADAGPGEPEEFEALIAEDDGEEDDDEDESEEESGDAQEGGEAEDGEGAEGAAAAAPTPTKAKDEDEPPGPDVPAPPKATLLKAMQWAFEGEDVEPELLEKYAEHAHLLLDHNRRVNLTAILDPKEVAAQHYYDSWRLTQYYGLVARRVVDLGTGGGFPGIPLALAEPNCSFVFIDSTKKKVDFVQECIEKLGLRNATAYWGRAEEWLARERCDVVLVRAVSSVRENVRTLRKVRHSLKELFMYKGPSWSREVRAGEREAERLGFHMDTVWEYKLPDEMGQRAILVYRAPGGQGI